MIGAEDQVSLNQQVERSKMERDYQAQMATLSDELNRVRQELTSRTEVMGQEMERWRQTAEATSRCVSAVGSKRVVENHEVLAEVTSLCATAVGPKQPVQSGGTWAEALPYSSHQCV